MANFEAKLSPKALFQKNSFNSEVKDSLAKWAQIRLTETCVIAPKPSVEYQFAIEDISKIICEVSILTL